uniref:UNC93-like protein MFSD11 n=1 Tax=Chrysocystis fragilis TaxID=1411660 RepID=A0A7S0TBD5_9STRA|mmetsp:Transcript_345/g.1053  ORF Transcript_345/g.1053 Transcript_345/m.1053 type:complete len:498 (+) Transcript_345:138-1631(+)
MPSWPTRWGTAEDESSTKWSLKWERIVDVHGARATDSFSWLAGVEDQDVGRVRIVLMATGFLFIFMAFNTTQTILSTVLQHFTGWMTGLSYDLGNASLMIMYLTACPSLCVVPSVIRRHGAVSTLMIGGLCYAVYITSLVFVWEPTVLASSCVVGFGQATIWVAQGVLLTSNSDESSRGRDAGLFWGIYSCSGIVGPAIGFVVYEGMNSRGFFLFATLFTLIGALFFQALKSRSVHAKDGEHASALLRSTTAHDPAGECLIAGREALDSNDQTDTESGRAARGAHAAVSGSATKDQPSFSAEKTTVLLKLVPFMLFVGTSDSFVMSTFPLIFAPSSAQEGAVFLVFLGWGLTETVGALVLSRVSDTIGRRALVYVGALTYLIALALSWLLLADSRLVPAELDPLWCRVSWLSFVAGALFGLSDALSNTQAYALIGDNFLEPHENIRAYSAFQLMQSIGMAAGFAFSLVIPIDWRRRYLVFGSQLGTLVASVVGVLLL